MGKKRKETQNFLSVLQREGKGSQEKIKMKPADTALCPGTENNTRRHPRSTVGHNFITLRKRTLCGDPTVSDRRGRREAVA